MFARVTPYRMKSDKFEEGVTLLQKIKDEIMSLPGVKTFVNVGNEDGSGYAITILESQEISDANAAKVQAIWGKFADFLAETPVPEGYDVIAHWNN